MISTGVALWVGVAVLLAPAAAYFQLWFAYFLFLLVWGLGGLVVYNVSGSLPGETPSAAEKIEPVALSPREMDLIEGPPYLWQRIVLTVEVVAILVLLFWDHLKRFLDLYI